MTKDEALKLALEHFETWSHEDSIFAGEFDKEITAIKEALAQPEQEPVAWIIDYNACKCPDNEARCFSDKVFRMMQKHTDSLAKQHEPVAKVCHDLDGHIGWNPNLLQLPDEGTPLYTTPPQRKPLTDEEIRSLWDGHVVPVFGKNGINPIVFARSIEAAHGIKE